jgi:hypothetical protein
MPTTLAWFMAGPGTSVLGGGPRGPPPRFFISVHYKELAQPAEPLQKQNASRDAGVTGVLGRTIIRQSWYTTSNSLVKEKATGKSKY